MAGTEKEMNGKRDETAAVRLTPALAHCMRVPLMVGEGYRRLYRKVHSKAERSCGGATSDLSREKCMPVRYLSPGTAGVPAPQCPGGGHLV